MSKFTSFVYENKEIKSTGIAVAVVHSISEVEFYRILDLDTRANDIVTQIVYSKENENKEVYILKCNNEYFVNEQDCSEDMILYVPFNNNLTHKFYIMEKSKFFDSIEEKYKSENKKIINLQIKEKDLKNYKGRIFRHFKGDLYLLLDIAEDTETGKTMVVYKALYEENKVYVREISMFLSPVDRKKYPNAEQEYRFELYDVESVKNKKEYKEKINKMKGIENTETGDEFITLEQPIDLLIKHTDKISCINKNSLLLALKSNYITELLKTGNFNIIDLENENTRNHISRCEVMFEDSIGKIISVDLENLTAKISIKKELVNKASRSNLKFSMLGKMINEEFIVKTVLAGVLEPIK